jgi:predicted secreted acid phosphatase
LAGTTAETPVSSSTRPIAYAEGLKLASNGKEVWVFDIDETSLSNLPYYAKHGFGYVRRCT